MGMLLRFSPRPSRSAPAAPASGVESAKVLLFTGIRYEREQEMGPTRPARRTRRTRKG